jgi:hypothetical protein
MADTPTAVDMPVKAIEQNDSSSRESTAYGSCASDESRGRATDRNSEKRPRTRESGTRPVKR